MESRSDDVAIGVSESGAADLLRPVVAFLHASGMKREGINRAFRSVHAEAAKSRTRVPVRRLDGVGMYAEIVGNWTKNPDFLDATGRPRLLGYSGRRSFTTLVAMTDKSARPKEVLATLYRYGNVARERRKLRLLRPFFHVRSTNGLAYEPSAHFLADASATVHQLLKSSALKNEAPQLFWRTAYTSDLPVGMTSAYIEFARKQSLLFLQQIDDWLQAHAKPRLASAKTRRVGVGLFSICSQKKAGRARRRK